MFILVLPLILGKGIKWTFREWSQGSVGHIFPFLEDYGRLCSNISVSPELDQLATYL